MNLEEKTAEVQILKTFSYTTINGVDKHARSLFVQEYNNLTILYKLQAFMNP